MDPKKITTKSMEAQAREISRRQGGTTGKWDRWEELLPALERAWNGWVLMHGFDPDWKAQDRALYDLVPRLYRDYRNGETPAMEHGAAKAQMRDQVSAYWKRWGSKLLLQDIEDYLPRKK